MFFLQNISKYKNKVALICKNNEKITYNQLCSESKIFIKNIEDKSLVFLLAGNNKETLISYLSLLKSDSVIVFINENTKHTTLENLITIYKPNYIFGNKNKIKTDKKYNVHSTHFDYFLLKLRNKNKIRINNNLKIMMPTSGSTGSKKYVRISELNLISNTKSIIDYLSISSKDVAITTLPISYVYGLSIINTHLHQGASIVLNNESMINKNFWKNLNKYKVNNFNGVPYTYEILNKLKFDKLNLKNIKYFTQAGGKLNENLSKKIIDYCKKENKKFFTMYGAAEATARMSYVPWNHASNKIGSIGITVKGGRLWIEKDEKKIEENNTEGELVYSGKNVSMGYATNVKDLNKGDENKGILKTGDIAKKDNDNFFYIQGRKDRYVKIFGNRVNLFELEEIISSINIKSICLTNSPNKINIYAVSDKKNNKDLVELLNKNTELHPNIFIITNVKNLPINQNFKTNYNNENIIK